MCALFAEPPVLPDDQTAQVVALGVAYIICAPNQQIVAASDGAADLLEFPGATLVGQGLSDVCMPLVGTETQLEEVCAGTRSHILIEQINLLDDNGQPRYISLVALPHLAGLLVILSDVTLQSAQQQRLQQQHHELLLLHERVAEQNRQLRALNEELTTLSQRKSDMLAIVTHDLRSPLTVVLGYAQLLERSLIGDLDPDQRESVEAIHRQGRQMLTLVDKLLDLRRLESEQAINQAPVLLNEMLAQVARAFGDQARLANVALQYEHVGDVVMLGDWDAVLQAVVNLASNGLKYTLPGGSVTLRCRYADAPLGSGLDASRRWCAVDIADTGPGISPEDIERLFTPFFRTADARSSGKPGSGFGLTIVQMAVQRHGGQAFVESTPGTGTTFTLLFPAAE